MEILGASLDAHPLELVVEKIAKSGAITTLEAAERIGRRVTVAGVRQTSHRSHTAKSLVGTSAPLLVTGVMEMDSERGEPFLRVERVVMV